MIFPVPIPMYLPSSPYPSYSPSINTRGIESGLGDIHGAIKDMSAKLDKKDICITVDTDSIRGVMAFVGPHVIRESEAYHQRAQVTWKRINRIDKWKKHRRDRAKKAKEKEAKDWNEALKLDAEFNYRKQPRGHWWKGWVEIPYSKFLKDSGYVEPKVEEKLGARDDFFKAYEALARSQSRLEEVEWNHKIRGRDVARVARKPHWIEQKDQLVKLWQICEQIRGAQLQVPSDLMQMVAGIVKESNVQIQQGNKCVACGSHDFVVDDGRKVCTYCRTPRGT